MLIRGIYGPPLSGSYHSTASPTGGWKGLKEAIARAPPGGSVLLRAGKYEYGPKDLVQLPFAPVAEEDPAFQLAALVLDRSVHLFGHCKVELVPASGIPFAAWGIKAHTSACAILASAGQYSTLNGISVRGMEGSVEADWTHSVVCEGRLGVYKCRLSASPTGGGYCLDVFSKPAFATILDCRFRGGYFGVCFQQGGGGYLESCDIRKAKEACVGMRVGVPFPQNNGRYLPFYVLSNTLGESRFGLDADFDVDVYDIPMLERDNDYHSGRFDGNVFEASLGGEHKPVAGPEGEADEEWEVWEELGQEAGEAGEGGDVPAAEAAAPAPMGPAGADQPEAVVLAGAGGEVPGNAIEGEEDAIM